jgi:hypothetical protein
MNLLCVDIVKRVFKGATALDTCKHYKKLMFHIEKILFKNVMSIKIACVTQSINLFYLMN